MEILKEGNPSLFEETVFRLNLNEYKRRKKGRKSPLKIDLTSKEDKKDVS